MGWVYSSGDRSSLELTDAECGTDDLFESLRFVEEGDFDSEKKHRDIARWEWGEADRIFFGGDEGKAAAGAGAGEGVFDFGGGEAVVVGKGALVDDFGSEANESLHKAFGNGDGGDGSDAKTPEIAQGVAFACEKIFEVKWVMAARVNGGVAVMVPNLFLNLGVIFAGAFREEDEIGTAESIGGLAEDSAGENVLIAERVLPVDEEEVKAVAQTEVLESIIEEKSVGLVVADGVACGFDAIGIDENGHAREVASEHEGFVASLGGVEQDRFSVGHDTRGGGGAAGEELIGEASKKGFGYGFVSAAEDSDAAARFLKGAGEFFDDGGFAGASDGEVTDADDHDTDRVAAEDGILVEAGANTHDACVDGRE